jgi:crotonobetaine/carnitine-CoA ligase
MDPEEGFAPLLQRRARVEPNRVFARFGAQVVTFQDLDCRSSMLAAWIKRLGIARGDRVALMLRNTPIHLALLFAVAKSGTIWVPVNVRERGDNLAYILDHSQPKLVIAEADLAAAIESSGANLGGAILETVDIASSVTGDKEASTEPIAAAEQTFAIMYTSGTSGPPKGVLVSHRMLRIAGEAVAVVSAAGAGDVMFMWEPLFHIGGAQMIVLPLIADVTLALVERFSASRFWEMAKSAAATHVHYLGGVMQMLFKQPPGLLDKAHGVRIAWGGGCRPDIRAPVAERFGVAIRECYGMTEASSITTANLDGSPGSVGKPMPWFTVELLNANGLAIAQGERGEIVVRTSLPGAITAGYYRDPQATKRALRDGALYTGDIGKFDGDGNLMFRGRKSDSARVRGENVSAFQVESVAAQHPAVADSAMIAVASEIGEQNIKLFVQAKAGATLNAAELSQWLAERLAPYQNPRYIVLIDDFQRTASHRIMKHKLTSKAGEVFDRLAQPKSGRDGNEEAN